MFYQAEPANDDNLYHNKLLMRYLADQPIWTTNNINPNLFTKSKSPLKVPLDAYALLHDNKVTPHRNQADHPTLLTLNDLKALPADYVQRVLFDNVLTTHILCVDAENDSIQYQGDIDKEQSDSDGYWRGYTKELMLNTPAIYTEESSHGGWHRLYYIPDDLLQASRYQTLFKSNIKFPFHTLEVFGNGTHAMTLTTKAIVSDKFNSAAVDSEAYHDKMVDFLDECLSQLHRNAYVNDDFEAAGHTAIKKYDFTFANPQQQKLVTNLTDVLYQLLMGNAQAKLQRQNNDDGNDNATDYRDAVTVWLRGLRNRAVDKTTGSIDLSKRDWIILGAIAGELDYEYSYQYPDGLLQGQLKRDDIGGLNSLLNSDSVALIGDGGLDAKTFCLAVCKVMRKLGERYDFARAKWDSDRDGQPWLLYDTILLFQQYGYNKKYGNLA